MIRRRHRHVRIHLDGMEPSLQGILVGRWAGHYVLRVPELVTQGGRVEPLDGRDVKVPAGRVLFIQELTT